MPGNDLVTSVLSNDTAGGGSFTTLHPTRYGNLGMRLAPSGAFSDYTTSATGTTFITTLALAQDYDAIQLVYAQGATATGGAVAATVAGRVIAISDLTNTPTFTIVDATFGGAATGTIPLGSAAGTLPTTTRRKSYLISDVVPINSYARTDGGTLPLVQVRSFVSNTSAVVNFMGGVYANINTVWNTHPSGRIWKNQVAAGDVRTASITAGNGVGLGINCPLLGVIYYARGQVVNVATFGDSIYEGQDPPGEGFVFPAVVALSNKNGLAFEHSNLAWTGSNYNEIRSQAIDALAANLPIDIAIIPGWTPNGQVAPTLNQNSIFAEQTMMNQIAGLLKAKNIPVIVGTGAPMNTSYKAFGANDSFRVAYNNSIRALANRGIAVIDLDASLAGVDDGTGQIQYKVGLGLSDGVHPAAAGNALIIPRVLNALQQATYSGGRVY